MSGLGQAPQQHFRSPSQAGCDLSSLACWQKVLTGVTPPPPGLLSMEAILAAPPHHQPLPNTKSSDRLLWHGTERVLGREPQALSQAESMICDCVAFNQHTFFPKHKVNVEGLKNAETLKQGM